jgi:hypothetical protein
LAACPALGQNVKVTPVGSHPGELCANDRAIIFEANEPVTEGGKLRPASRKAAVIKEMKATTHLAISGRTMEFDGKGKCVAGC